VEQNSRDIEAIKRENADIKAENAIIKAENEALKGSLCKNMDCKNRKTK
jgi:cell division protein FtsB